MTKWVHDLGLGFGPIPTREVSREELEKMYPTAGSIDNCEWLADEFVKMWTPEEINNYLLEVGLPHLYWCETCEAWHEAEKHVK